MRGERHSGIIKAANLTCRFAALFKVRKGFGGFFFPYQRGHPVVRSGFVLTYGATLMISPLGSCVVV